MREQTMLILSTKAEEAASAKTLRWQHAHGSSGVNVGMSEREWNAGKGSQVVDAVRTLEGLGC